MERKTMKSVSVHADYFQVIRKHSAEDIGKFFLALASDIDGGEKPKLPDTLEMLKELIDAQNQRFAEGQSGSGKKGGAPAGNQNAKKQPKTTQNNQDENNPNNPTVTDTVTGDRDTGDNAPLTPHEKKPQPQKGEYADFVSMTNDEHSSLVAKLGEKGAARCVEILDNYKGSRAKSTPRTTGRSSTGSSGGTGTRSRDGGRRARPGAAMTRRTTTPRKRGSITRSSRNGRDSRGAVGRSAV